MKRTLGLLAAGIAGALITLLAMSLASGALAQGPAGQPAAPAPATYGARMGGRGPMADRQMGGEQSLVGMAAAQLHLTQAELVAQLGETGTIAQALSDGGISPTQFVDDFVASRAKRLEAAVAAGRMTEEQARAQLELARSMAAARISQPFTALGPGGQNPSAPGAGQGFVDANGDGACDHAPAGGQGPAAGQGRMGGGRGPRR